uniref:Uncharacterized protein n=1 Tax=viral metagenome TaxID=1070528 RepID=A0A6C0BEQ2_9ZZZZ
MKRINCEYNIYELICASFYVNKSINLSTDLLNHMESNLTKIICYDIDKYKQNINKKNKNKYFEYYQILQKENKICYDNIEKIYLTGKSYSKYPEIVKLNKNYNKKQTKGDIYIVYENKEIVSLSVKQDYYCTETNYSVYKFFDKTETNILKEKFNKLIENKNLQIKSKLDRNKINEIFYVRDNDYFNKLKLYIDKYNDIIIKSLIYDLLSLDIEYKLYKFNGASFNEINKKTNIDNIYFDECSEFYKTKNDKNRKCSKMFYKLKYDNITYRVEIRWKGSFTSSPQFMCFSI